MRVCSSPLCLRLRVSRRQKPDYCRRFQDTTMKHCCAQHTSLLTGAPQPSLILPPFISKSFQMLLNFCFVWVLVWANWSTRILQSIHLNLFTYDENVEGPPLAWSATCLHRPAHHCVAMSPLSAAAEATSITRREERGGGQPSRSVLTSGASYSDWQEAAAALCAVISSLSSQIIIFEEAEL